MPLVDPEEGAEEERNLKPCEVCGTPTDVHPICERWQLCLPCVSDWFADGRFQGDYEKNIAATPAWLAEKRAARAKGTA